MDTLIALFIGISVGFDLFFFIVWKSDTWLNISFKFMFITLGLFGAGLLINMFVHASVV